MSRNVAVVQIANGVFQTVSWPCCVAIMAKWFGKGNRGSVMGFWCALMNMGDILGTLSASLVVKFGWGWSFIIPGLFTVLVTGILFVFLEEEPTNVQYSLVDGERGDRVPGGLKRGKKVARNDDVHEVVQHAHIVFKTLSLPTDCKFGRCITCS